MCQKTPDITAVSLVRQSVPTDIVPLLLIHWVRKCSHVSFSLDSLRTAQVARRSALSVLSFFISSVFLYRHSFLSLPLSPFPSPFLRPSHYSSTLYLYLHFIFFPFFLSLPLRLSPLPRGRLTGISGRAVLSGRTVLTFAVLGRPPPGVLSAVPGMAIRRGADGGW